MTSIVSASKNQNALPQVEQPRGLDPSSRLRISLLFFRKKKQESRHASIEIAFVSD